jgi:hypothetical protein
MIGKVILWLVIIYIVGVVLWRLAVAVPIIFTSYKEGGIKGGFIGLLGVMGMNLLMIIMDIWGFAKFAIGILVILLIIRACSH